VAKNWWEFTVKTNEQGNAVYQDDCQITVVELGEIKEYSQRDFQSIGVLDANNQTARISVSYAKGDKHLHPGALNKPLPCRVKVEPDSSQYAIAGRKFTVAFGKPKSSGGSRSGTGSTRKYQEDPKTAWKKTRCQVVCAMIAAGQFGDAVNIAAVDEIVKNIFSEIPQQYWNLLDKE
jgi:hypothetical protein